MHQHAVFCKSFRDDFARLERLLESIKRSSGSSVPVLLSVPDHDLKLLKQEISLPSFVHCIPDEEYTVPGKVFEYGWLQQQICKLSVHRTQFARSYLMLDSDSYVISPIDSTIFHTNKIPNVIHASVHTKYELGNDGLKKLILSEEEPNRTLLNDGTLLEFAEELKGIRAVERPDMHPDERGSFIRRLFRAREASTQPGQIFHSDLLHSLQTFLEGHNLSFYDAIALSPWEYGWYGHYVAASKDVEAVGITSPIIHFASDDAIADAKHNGITIDKLRRKFLAIQMAARHFDTIEF